MLADIRFSFLAPFGLVSGTDQPHNGQGTRPDDPAVVAAAGRWGDSV